MTTALYRRYRPDTFQDVIGQDHVTVPLRTALSKNRVNHAYLFSGPRGCGKTTSARILARCLNCEQGPTPTPCGECDSCRDLATGGPGSLDVIEIDAASHGGVDDARDLRERATFAPARDRYKIFIIDEAHMVTSAGFNALLKIVEEPPEHIKFIFATTEPEKVIGTIRSRTHHYPFRLIPPEPMIAYVQKLCDEEHVQVAPGVLPLVVRAGGGSARDTLSVLDQLMAGAAAEGISYDLAVSLLGYTHAELLDDVVDALAAADAATVFGAVDRVVQSGLDPRRFVEDLLERFRDLIVVRAVPENAGQVLHGVPADQLERMAAQATALAPSELSRWGDVTNTALSEMTGATSPRLHLELLCARLLLPSSDHTERGLAARVDRLERHLKFGGAPVEAGEGERVDAPEQGRAVADATVPDAAGPGTAGPAPQAAGWGGGTSGAAAARQALRAAQDRPEEAAAAPQPRKADRAPAVTEQPLADTSGWAHAAAPTPAPPVDTSPADDAPTGSPLSDFVPTAEELADAEDDFDEEFEPIEEATGGTPQPPNAPATDQQDQPPAQDQRPEQAQPRPEQAQAQAQPERAQPQAQPEQAQRPGQDQNPAQVQRPEQTQARQQAEQPQPRPEQAQRPVQDQNPAQAQRPEQAQQRPVQDQNPAQAQRPEQAQPPAQDHVPHPQGGSGSVEMFRRAWPDIMDHLKDSRRFVWSMVQPHVSIAGFDGRTLTLAFANPGPMTAFRSRPDAMDLVRSSIRAVLGVDPDVDVTAGGSGPGANRGESDPKAEGRPTPARPAEDEHDPSLIIDREEPWDEESDGPAPEDARSTPPPAATPRRDRPSTQEAPAAPVPRARPTSTQPKSTGTAEAPAAPVPGAASGWSSPPSGAWAPAPAEPRPEAPAPAAAPASGRPSKYQQLMAQARRSDAPPTWGAPSANTPANGRPGPVESEPEEFIPSDDDEELENSTTFGRQALERLLDATLVEELDHNGQPLSQRP